MIKTNKQANYDFKYNGTVVVNKDE